ncbi:A-kinase anchoring protein 7 isoform X2 [Ambystoma mexicanum]|uniref:A-kinase anchoring protein 7 isoform X2 n=1 Tax=Ambystoma mexicanum TaxID=8296 RepID=UPI0037E7316D
MYLQHSVNTCCSVGRGKVSLLFSMKHSCFVACTLRRGSKAFIRLPLADSGCNSQEDPLVTFNSLSSLCCPAFKTNPKLSHSYVPGGCRSVLDYDFSFSTRITRSFRVMFQECESTLMPEEKQSCTMEGDRRPIEDQQKGALEERYGLENELQPPLGVPESVKKQRWFQKGSHELTREQHGLLVTKEQHGTLPCEWAPVNVEKCGPLDQLEGPMVGCPVSVEGFQEVIACAHNYTLSVVQAVAVPMEQDQRIKLVSLSSTKEVLHWSPEGGPEHIQKREEVLVGYQESAEESETSDAVIPGPNSEMEGTHVGAIPRPRDEAPVSLEGQAACDCYAEEPVLPAPAQPAPNSPEKAKTEFECLFLEPTVSVMMQDTDTDVSEELDELKNVLDDKKRKKKKRCRPRKKKKKSEPPDTAAIIWLEELPFSSTDIGKLFGIPRESGKSTEKKRKEQALKESKKKKKEKEASPNYFISLPITNPKIVADIEMIQNTVIKKDDRLSRAMVPQGTLHITLFVMHLASEDDVCSAINALSESKGAIEEILEGKHLVLSFEGVADFRNQVIFAKLAGEDTTENNLIVMRETLQRKFKEKGIPVKEDKGFTPHLTFLKLSRSPKLRKQGLKKVDLKLYEEFSNHYFGEDSLTSLDLCSMQKKRQPSGYYHCESSIGFGSMPQKIPGTSQPNSMSPVDEEDLIDSASFHKSVGTRITSFSDHTSEKNGREPDDAELVSLSKRLVESAVLKAVQQYLDETQHKNRQTDGSPVEPSNSDRNGNSSRK